MKQVMRKFGSLLLAGTLVCSLALGASAASGETLHMQSTLGQCYTINGITETTKMQIDRTSIQNSKELGSDGQWILGLVNEGDSTYVYSVPENTSIDVSGLFSWNCADLHLQNGLLRYIDQSGVSLSDALKVSTKQVPKEIGEATVTVFDANSSVTFLKSGYYAFSAIPYPEALDKTTAMGKVAAILKVGDGGAEATTAPLIAKATTSKVIIDGKAVAFEAYNILDNNYFKLRDIAQALSGSSKQFDISWDNNEKLVSMLCGKAYTPVGKELTPGDGTDKQAVLANNEILRDGAVLNLSAYLINDNNYIKLRTLASALDFNVTWDSATNNILIDTTKSYSPS